MQIETRQSGEMLLVQVADRRIDAAVAIQFKDRMREITRVPAARVLLDLQAVEFLDSSGLGAIVAVMKALSPGQRLELCALTPTVATVFRLTRMDTIFVIHDTAAAALAGAGLRDAG